MCGSTRSTTSPSSSSTRRSTPWAAGCCGPKLMVKLRSAVAASAMSHRCLHGFFGNSGREFVPADDHALVLSFADDIDTVMRADVKACTPSVHLRALCIHSDVESGRRCRRMTDVDMNAETAL